MTKPIDPRLLEATNLTRAGNLQEATRLIREALGRSTSDAARTAEHAGPTIDLSAGPSRRRRPLKEVVEEFARAPRPRTGKAPFVADGASYRRFTHVGPHGARDYTLYVPARGAGTERPLVAMLHGCTQTADDFALGTRMNERAEEFGTLVVYPEQPRTANHSLCWNWFEPLHQEARRGEPAILAGLMGEVVAREGADPSRVFVAGLSAGGAMAAILGAGSMNGREEGSIAGVAIHSGLPAGAARDLPSALQAMRVGASGRRATMPATIVFHGTTDATVHPSNALRIVEAAGGNALHRETVRAGGRPHRRFVGRGASGKRIERWEIDGLAHAWSGGSPDGSHTDAAGPDASREMLRFFLERSTASA